MISNPVAAAAPTLFSPHRYPSELIDHLTLADGRRVLLRPVLPQDSVAEQAFFSRLSPRSRRLRFHGAITLLPDTLLVSMTQIDYRCHLALVAETFNNDGPALVADARYVCNDDCDEAEFAIAVADDWQGQGLATSLLRRLARHAASNGIVTLAGDVLVGNEAMEKLMHRLGARFTPDRHDASVQRVRFAL